MSKPTPGPWRFEEERGEDMGGFYAGEDIVCHFGDSTQFYPSEGIPPSEANARLIAAAPDLLKAVWQLTLGPAHPDWAKHVEEARAAIAKAQPPEPEGVK